MLTWILDSLHQCKHRINDHEFLMAKQKCKVIQIGVAQYGKSLNSLQEGTQTWLQLSLSNGLKDPLTSWIYGKNIVPALKNLNTLQLLYSPLKE